MSLLKAIIIIIIIIIIIKVVKESSKCVIDKVGVP
jgi:hypothetical protein